MVKPNGRFIYGTPGILPLTQFFVDCFAQDDDAGNRLIAGDFELIMPWWTQFGGVSSLKEVLVPVVTSTPAGIVTGLTLTLFNNDPAVTIAGAIFLMIPNRSNMAL